MARTKRMSKAVVGRQSGKSLLLQGAITAQSALRRKRRRKLGRRTMKVGIKKDNFGIKLKKRGVKLFTASHRVLQRAQQGGAYRAALIRQREEGLKRYQQQVQNKQALQNLKINAVLQNKLYKESVRKQLVIENLEARRLRENIFQAQTQRELQRRNLGVQHIVTQIEQKKEQGAFVRKLRSQKQQNASNIQIKALSRNTAQKLAAYKRAEQRLGATANLVNVVGQQATGSPVSGVHVLRNATSTNATWATLAGIGTK